METQEQIGMSVGLPPETPRSPELPAEPVQPLAQGSSTQPSVTSGATGLAWWHSMKYEWRRSGAGNQYLAPQLVYVTDVLHRAEAYTALLVKELNKEDFADFKATADSIVDSIQSLDGMDQAGVEGHALRRHFLTRLVLSRKICGASAVSAEHRCVNEISRVNGNVDKMKADSEGYYASDISKRNQWGLKALMYAHIVRVIADGEVIPFDEVKLNELVGKRVATGKGIGLGDEAYEVGRTLQRPPQAAVAKQEYTSAELMAMTA